MLDREGFLGEEIVKLGFHERIGVFPGLRRGQGGQRGLQTEVQKGRPSLLPGRVQEEFLGLGVQWAWRGAVADSSGQRTLLPSHRLFLFMFLSLSFPPLWCCGEAGCWSGTCSKCSGLDTKWLIVNGSTFTAVTLMAPK